MGVDGVVPGTVHVEVGVDLVGAGGRREVDALRLGALL